MWKIISAWILFACAVTNAWTKEIPQITAESAILVDAISGKVLYEKQCHKRMEPASTTKIMTAILTLENAKLDESVTASKKASSTPYGSLHLLAGERMKVKDLLYGLLLRSGNDAAVCLAEHIAGSESEFIKKMNEKAVEIGAEDTHFANPHGLHDEKHSSTAYDLAMIARYAIRIPEFNEIVRTKTIRIQRSLNSKDVYLKNTARFLWHFDGADGIKTGYTKEAGHCFVGSATRNGWRLIAVVLKSKNAGQDIAYLLEYGFRNYKQVSFARKNEVITQVQVRGGIVKEIPVVAGNPLALVFPKSASVSKHIKVKLKRVNAPVAKGEPVGELVGYIDGLEAGRTVLTAGASVDRTLAATIWMVVRTILMIIFISTAGFIAYGTAVAKIARRRRRSLAARS